MAEVDLQNQCDELSVYVGTLKSQYAELVTKLNRDVLPWVIELDAMEQITTSKAKELIQIWNPNYTYSDAREVINTRYGELFDTNMEVGNV
jgi:hypothetical protein